ncbi:hypothetical protein R1flu_011006 [Riccia fluitans]|uniref:Phytocyanin domain-containing protein n=1 Tax=Riccia fluitans TaxID=41844 RepID=A0ABD1Z7N6_9MARC
MAHQGGANAVCTIGVLVMVFGVLVLCENAAATTVNVGGASGWTVGHNYKTWAAFNKVRPYDSLFFKYDPKVHNVLVVSKADYDACKTSSPWSKHQTGKDFIKFTKSGTYYLICGVGSHCQAGMKLAVTVRWW